MVGQLPVVGLLAACHHLDDTECVDHGQSFRVSFFFTLDDLVKVLNLSNQISEISHGNLFQDRNKR